MSARVEAPLPEPGELDLGKPAFKMAYLNVPVTDPYKTLDIEVSTDADSYRPRDTVTVAIRAQPRNRELREPIEVAVVVLDEAVLDLIQGGTDYYDPYRGFNGLDGLDLRNYGLLTRLVGRQRIELKGANPGGDPQLKVDIARILDRPKKSEGARTPSEDSAAPNPGSIASVPGEPQRPAPDQP
jgi:uncharacterized protein YfaS (alpha-2-macroglobulin family)